MTRFFHICWAYFVEVALAALIYAALIIAFGQSKVADFVVGTWGAWSSLCGVVLAAAVTMFVLVFQMLTSDFGGYLVSRKADGPFRNAYAFAILVSSSATAAFVIAGRTTWIPASHCAGFLLILVGINLYTMISNAKHLVRMHSLFERIKRRADRDETL